MQGIELRPPLHLDFVAIEKGAFGSTSTTIANFTYLYSGGNDDSPPYKFKYNFLI